MKDQSKTKQALIQELASLRRRIEELEQSESEWKKGKEGLINSKALFGNYFDLPLHGIAITSPEKGWIEVNDRICSIMGYPRDEIVRMTWSEMTHSDDLAADLAQYNRVLSGQIENYNMDKRFIRKDGKVVWTNLSVGCVRKSDGSVDHFIALVQDITSGKLAEEALKEREATIRVLMDSPLDSVLLVNTDGIILETNKTFAKRMGRRIEELIGMCVYDLLPSELAEKRQARVEEVVRLGVPIRLEDERDGMKLDQSVYPILDAQGHVAKIAIIARDITERKLVEEALSENRKELRAIYAHAPVMKCVLDDRRRVLYANTAFTEFTGISEMDLQKGLACGVFGCINALDDFRGCGFGADCKNCRILEAVEDTFKTGQSHRDIEHRAVFAFKDVRREVILIGATALVKDVYPSKLLLCLQDITERKQAEEQIQASLREKEILLREIHHRVKNNIQVISGLLDLQARSSGNPELTGMLNESQKRIRSMALIHERLYSSKDFARIDLVGYVRALAQDLFQSYKINSGKIDLIIQTDGDVYVNINKAIPCGLILNELISNVLKHAFPGDGPGKLQIIIHETKDTEIEIVVRDNGLGLPDDVDIHEPRTVGLYLINGLVKNQLDGQVEVRRDNGTEFRIIFSL